MHKHGIPGLLFFFSITLVVPTSVQAGALEEGRQAFQAGRYKQAMAHWQPLATQNNPDALYNIGLLYMKGLGVNKDPRAAIDWFKKAANYGSVDAAYNLGSMYMGGEGRHPSMKDALYWWRQSAAAGHPESQFNLGVMLVYGKGTRQDMPGGIALWEKAARQGNQDAVKALIKTYTEGLLGQQRDAQRAGQWRRYLSR